MQPGVSIYRVDANGAGLTRIGPGVDAYVTFGQPDVSPDGSTLAVRKNGALMSMEVATGALVRIGARGEANEPRWSPDGSHIAFRDYMTYWIVNADGSNERLLADANTQGDVFPGHGTLDWSPDGGWLIIRASGRLQLLDPVTGGMLPLPTTTRLVAAVWLR
jgi:Tol biopolymer transport system component